MAAPGLERHRLALLAAREDVGNPRAGTDWAVFGYEKHHDLKLLDSGAGGPDELAGKFSAGSVMYGLCRVPEPGTGAPRVVLISWVGEKVPEAQREACAGHLPVLRGFFREASAVLSARRPEEVTREGLSRALAQVELPGAPVTRRVPPPDTQELVGTNYRKTNPALELRRTQRDSFWAQAEREEQQRREEERRRALEEQQRWERLRRHQERREAAERERRCQDKEREIQEQRKAQALLEAEERRKEKERWEQQQREHEEAMRDRGRSSESIGKAAEAAVLVSQRPQNPRDFFRQRERSGSTSGAPGPAGPPRPGARRPFLRYQRSLTETAFIFRRPEPPAPPAAPQHRESGERPPAPAGTAGTGSPPETPNSHAGTPPSATLGTPPGPARAGSPHATRPAGTGTPPAATLGTPTVGTGTLPSAIPGPPPSPMGMGIPRSATTGTPISPIGTGTPQSASSGTPPSPARAGYPCATRPMETGTPPTASSGTPTMATGTLPSATTGSPPSPIGRGTPPSATLGTLSSPIEGGNPPSATPGTPLSPMEAAAGSPPLPSPPPAESLPPDPCPLPSPPAWGAPEGLEEGGLSPRGPSPVPGPPPCGPSPPLLPPGPQPGPMGQEPPRGDSGHNGIGGHVGGLWAAPWGRDTPPPEGDEPSDSSTRHKAKPGFALLLTHPQHLGGSSAPPADEELSLHTV
ncbi:uncharacterized protein ACIB01_013745 [Guaruba guarouba]